jgi:hypothetical protein
MHSRQEASRAILEEHLFHPVNLKAAKSLRSEGTITAPNEITLKVRWSPNQAKFIHEQLTSWLTTGDINKLVKLLREEPVAITHPMVFWQLFHLRQLVRTPSEEEEGRRPVWTWKAERHGQDELDEAVLPKGVKPAAHQALQDLLTAWVSRLLPGYAVTELRQKRPKGAPQKWEMDAQLNVLLSFNELRDELTKIDENEFLAPKQGESRVRFLRRMSRIVERLNWLLPQALRTRRNKKAPKKPLPKGFQDDTAAWDELCQWETVYIPLPKDLALQIARLGWAPRLRKDRLLCSLLAYHDLRDYRKWNIIRRIVERAEGDFPQFDRRRPSRSRSAPAALPRS